MINNIKKTTEEFINESKKKFGDKFDYSKTNYITKKIKVCITCKKHGDFFILPHNHLVGNGGCPKCRSYTTEEYINALKSIYGDKFDYSKTKYINKNT